MGQDLVVVCHKCQLVIKFTCEFGDINKEEVQKCFHDHKGHNIMVCGTDWDLWLGDFISKGYKKEWINLKK